MRRPRLLDTFCGAGGCAMGYHRAGFEVVGIDIKLQPRYPFQFIQADALDFLSRHGHEFDVIHASPPCQAYSAASTLHNREYPDLIAVVRDSLAAIHRPYVIENVPGAPLQNYVMLCGTMFGLRVLRHRLFECSPSILMAPCTCDHWAKASSNRYMRAGKRRVPRLGECDILTVTGHDFIVEDARVAMGIDWMIGTELSQAIPPAYTKWLGSRILEVL